MVIYRFSISLNIQFWHERKMVFGLCQCNVSVECIRCWHDNLRERESGFDLNFWFDLQGSHIMKYTFKWIFRLVTILLPIACYGEKFGSRMWTVYLFIHSLIIQCAAIEIAAATINYAIDVNVNVVVLVAVASVQIIKCSPVNYISIYWYQWWFWSGIDCIHTNTYKRQTPQNKL